MTGLAIIRSERLALVAVAAAEFADIAMGHRDRHPWADDYPTAGDVLQARLAIEGERVVPTPAAPWGYLQVIDTSTGLAIGGAGFKFAPAEGESEIGYGICESRQGEGIATEVVGLLVEIARNQELNAVTAETDADNYASQRVLMKNGFEKTATAAESISWRLQLR